MQPPLAEVFDAVLADETVEAAETFLRGLLDAPTSSEEEELEGSGFTCTRWYELGCRPRNAVEAVIQALSKHPALGSCGLEGMAGAEWWWQEQLVGTDLPKEYHTDVDITRGDTGTFLRRLPVVSSVFYFGEVGGPTAVFDQAPVFDDARATCMEPVLPTQAVLVRPRRNRYLLFRGECFHAVMGAPEKDAGQTRLTLLVNWWQPGALPGVACRCPPEQASGSGAAEGGDDKDKVRHDGVASTATRRVAAERRDCADFAEHLADWRLQIAPAAGDVVWLHYPPSEAAFPFGFHWVTDDWPAQ
ncbi:unnamed protein product [Polarella glacialis]|uniref:Uncharacterized protein n=1 Tax=Polarella glacialis TaxID=89957 RepID=A0A813F9K7_POLGL|nr:unnamed protein product [Polarella glacialis]CAE8694986.1 unnamed protein product [Polarella glacialis]